MQPPTARAPEAAEDGQDTRNSAPTLNLYSYPAGNGWSSFQRLGGAHDPTAPSSWRSRAPGAGRDAGACDAGDGGAHGRALAHLARLRAGRRLHAHRAGGPGADIACHARGPATSRDEVGL